MGSEKAGLEGSVTTFSSSPGHAVSCHSSSQGQEKVQQERASGQQAAGHPGQVKRAEGANVGWLEQPSSMLGT